MTGLADETISFAERTVALVAIDFASQEYARQIAAWLRLAIAYPPCSPGRDNSLTNAAYWSWQLDLATALGRRLSPVYREPRVVL